MKYRARLSRRASRDLDSLERSIRRRVMARLEELQGDPFPQGLVKLKGKDGVYRVRIGVYRILYEVFRHERILLIVKIDHRSTVYG